MHTSLTSFLLVISSLTASLYNYHHFSEVWLQIPKSEPMDWYSWLSKSGLEPSRVYDYSLLFAHNELEEDDVPHFNHEFLQSMGISIAKHRLEILKLSKKRAPLPVARLVSALNKTKTCIARCLTNALSAGRDPTAIVVVPRPAGGCGGGRWKGAILKRNRRLVVLKQGRLMIADGRPNVRKPGEDPANHGASPVVVGGGGGKEDDGDGFWGSGGGEEMRWDSMFQDLKPT